MHACTNSPQLCPVSLNCNPSPPAPCCPAAVLVSAFFVTCPSALRLSAPPAAPGTWCADLPQVRGAACMVVGCHVAPALWSLSVCRHFAVLLYDTSVRQPLHAFPPNRLSSCAQLASLPLCSGEAARKLRASMQWRQLTACCRFKAADSRLGEIACGCTAPRTSVSKGPRQQSPLPVPLDVCRAEVAGRLYRASYRHMAHFTLLLILFAAAAYKSEVGRAGIPGSSSALMGAAGFGGTCCVFQRGFALVLLLLPVT